MSTAPSTPRPSTPTQNDDWAFMDDAMDAPSLPILKPNPQKQKRSDNGSEPEEDDSDDDELPANVVTTPTAQTAIVCSRNIMEKINRYATRKKLRPEQLCDIEKFLQEREVVQRAKLYVECFAVQNMIDNIVVAQPPYTVSKELKKNIDNYAWAIVLSPTLRSYKGSAPKDHLLAILRKFWFDLPPSIEHNTASWEKVTSQVESSLTQVRSGIKKAIRGSVTRPITVKADGSKKITYEPVNSGDAQNIYELTQSLIHNHKIFQRAVWHKDSTDQFWNSLDARLNELYDKAAKSEKRLRKAFEAVLKLDRETYGADTGYNIPAVGSEFQQSVDQMIVVHHANLQSSSSATPDAAGGSGEGSVGGTTTSTTQTAT